MNSLPEQFDKFYVDVIPKFKQEVTNKRRWTSRILESYMGFGKFEHRNG